MQGLNEILVVIKKNRRRLFKQYPIQSMAVFGSYSRDSAREDSDLDILVEFKDSIGIQFIDLAEDLENLIGKKIDLVSRNGIKDKYFDSISTDLIYV